MGGNGTRDDTGWELTRCNGDGGGDRMESEPESNTKDGGRGGSGIGTSAEHSTSLDRISIDKDGRHKEGDIKDGMSISGESRANGSGSGTSS
jgi:hypothetical protein